MAAIQLIAKSSGQVSDVSGKNLLLLTHPCVVKIAAAPDSIQSVSRNGDSLVIRLKNGEVVTVDNFFQAVDGLRHDLVLEAPDGQLWLADQSEPWLTTELDSIEQLLAVQSDDSYYAFGLLPMAGLGALGVGGLAAAAGAVAAARVAAPAARPRASRPCCPTTCRAWPAPPSPAA
ncbi:BapA prefix-like domain-containing protein [Pseudomonas sp. 273]|uniref:BapA/Bap/LapF family prefix-like domain-containing protein n=1 Tax=Pseudomonas sp. 273 TaxID=75692 RepID=UPI0023D8C602|nr:BapA prefix-like domain-containing protein [Pseudomonas sp. 273]